MGSLVSAVNLVLESSSGTLRLERGTLGELAAGVSATPSGIQLTGGLVETGALPLPEPALLYGLFFGIGLLALLRKHPLHR